MGIYKEDNTRGSSVLDPRSYKGEVNVQAWLDSRKLAMVSNWMVERGDSARFLSEVVKECVDIVVEHLVANQLVEKVEMVETARRILECRYKVKFGDSRGKGGKNRLHNLVLDERRREGMFRDSDSMYVEGVSNLREVKGAFTPEEYELILKRAAEEDEKEIREKIKNELSKLKYDENGLCINNSIEIKALPSDIKEWNRKAGVSDVSAEDKYTMRPFTEEEVRERVRLDNEKRERELREISAFDPSSCAIKDVA